MWNHKYLLRIDYRIVVAILFLMGISLLVISSMTADVSNNEVVFFTSPVKSQIERFIIGWIVFLFFAGFDYRKFSKYSHILYLVMVLVLLGLYLTQPIQRVHRWYRIPFINFSIQPSEFAKIVVVISLAALLEGKEKIAHRWSVILQIMAIVGIPFFLILKQPDLGSALVLYPITLVMGYLAGINKKIINVLSLSGLIGIVFVSLMFTNVLTHEKMRPFFTSFLKEYQYERLNPNTYHQKASQTSISIGGLTGCGWHKGEFAGKKFLPMAHTDSVFAAFGEEFGFIGIVFLLFLFYGLIYFSFQVSSMAKDRFGKLLSSGVAVYLSMHIIINIAMMIGFLPISGVPLILITYGGSSVMITMAALGILQSIYSRRFMF
jgi:rod shape determining protein RodA